MITKPTVGQSAWGLTLNAALDDLYAQLVHALPVLSVTRDSAGRVSAVTADGVTTTYTRDSAGRAHQITRGGVTRTVTRDAAGRVTGVS